MNLVASNVTLEINVTEPLQPHTTFSREQHK